MKTNENRACSKKPILRKPTFQACFVLMAAIVAIWFYRLNDKHLEQVPASDIQPKLKEIPLQSRESSKNTSSDTMVFGEIGPQEKALNSEIVFNTAKEAGEIIPKAILEPRARIINTLSKETLLESVNNLPNYDDVVPTTSMFSGGEVLSRHSYEYSRLLVYRLNRMRKIFASAKDNP